MKAKRVLITVFCLSLLLPFGTVFGDGGMFFHEVSSKDVLQPTQKVYIRWDGSQEKMLVQTKYQGPAEDMVWIVPVPAEPTVETADGTVFEDLGEKTGRPDIAHTSFATSLWEGSFGITLPVALDSFSAGGAEAPVAWHRRIGDYDVVLLRPVAGEDVVHWLNTNGYGIQDKAVPILEDYLRENWWMVASKIHPDALTDITREKLANGTLHPLEMTFSSAACVYPMRLTSMAAGPVEELIYIEGLTHYVPQTLSAGNWEIDIFGGPIRQVPQYHYQSDIESAIETLNGRTKTKDEPHLTKLRRVFQPQEMTQDLVFTPIDYSKWLESGDPLLIGQAATQYGRHRDPNGIPHLVKLLSSGILEQVRPEPYQYQPWPSSAAKILSWSGWDGYWYWTGYQGSDRPIPTGEHVYSLICALGEIGVEHKLGSEVEDLLLQCARHDNQFVRMEAYVALTKLQSEKLGPLLVDRLAYMPLDGPGSTSSSDREMLWAFACEMNIVTDWITRFGTASQKEALANALARPLASLLGPSKYGYLDPQHSAPAMMDWFEWVVWQAAGTQDVRLVASLQDLYARPARVNGGDLGSAFVQRALAACGSVDATEVLVRQIDNDEVSVLAEGGTPTVEGMTSLSSYYRAGHYSYMYLATSLRVQILLRHWLRYELYPMPSDVSDCILRSALSERELGDWYVLYLLAGIKEPQAGDRDSLMQIWAKGDPALRLVAVDVLYVWNDGPTLLSLHEKAESDDVKSEIAWTLADLGVAQAVHLIEERAAGSWNTAWQNCPRPFLIMTWAEIDEGDSTLIDAMRKAQAIQTYFHPKWEELDEERLAVLKRLGDNSAIHAGLRFDLFVTDYAAKDWAQPLLQKATRDVLEAYPSASTVATILSKVDVHLVVDACGEFRSDTPRQSLLLNLLGTGSYAFLPTIEGLLRQVWPGRYTETEGQSLLFREPGDLGKSIDYYCAHCSYARSRSSASSVSRVAEPILESIVKDDSLPAGYRAFLLVYWPTAPSRISKEFAESLLDEDVPDFIREALQKRLSDWQ